MFPELYKWYEFKANKAQVIWFRHVDDINALAVLHERGEWIYDGLGNYDAVSKNKNLWGEPTEKLTSDVLRDIIEDVFKSGKDLL